MPLCSLTHAAIVNLSNKLFEGRRLSSRPREFQILCRLASGINLRRILAEQGMEDNLTFIKVLKYNQLLLLTLRRGKKAPGKPEKIVWALYYPDDPL